MRRLGELAISVVLDCLLLAPAPFIAMYAIRRFREGDDFWAALLFVFALDYVVTFAVKREVWRSTRP